MLISSSCRLRRGVTFMEILVAMIVISVCIAGLLGAWQYSYQANTKSHRVMMAYNLARAGIETAKVKGYLNYPTGTTTTITTNLYTGTYTAPLAYYTAEGAATTQSSAFYTLQMKSVDVDVAGTTVGATYSLTMQTKRQISATVTLSSSGETLATMGTILVRGGI